jgi:hypothetical protein
VVGATAPGTGLGGDVESPVAEPAWGGLVAGYPEGMQDYWAAVLWSLLPTVVVSALFFFILRSVIRADRNERRLYARIEAQERAKRGLPPTAATTTATAASEH